MSRPELRRWRVWPATRRLGYRLAIVLSAWITPLWADDAVPPKRPVLPESTVDGGDLIQMLGGLALVIAAIVVLAWLVRRMGRLPMRGSKVLRVLGSLSMGARERVVLIEVGGKQILLGVAPGRVQTLHVLEETLELESDAASGGAFAERLRMSLQGKARK